jgi:large subunit ribosomal protein L19
MAEEKKKNEAAAVEENNDQEAEEKPLTGEAKEEEVVKADEAESPQAPAKKIGDLSFYSPVRTDLPEIKPGMVVRVFYRVIEGGKERIQVFEGTVIAIKNKGIAKTVTVRKTSFGIAVERIFPLNSKLIQKIEVKKRQKVRQAKLYYLRNLRGKAARLKELR